MGIYRTEYLLLLAAADIPCAECNAGCCLNKTLCHCRACMEGRPAAEMCPDRPPVSKKNSYGKIFTNLSMRF